ncbi:hypothetical protein BsWGS_18268 [Bradybaena similaris]
MFRSSCADIRAGLRSVSLVTNILSRPARLCQECQRRFICVKKRPSLYILNLKYSKGADSLLANSTAFFLHKCENQSVQWYNCVSRRCFSATLNKISNKNVTPTSESISKTPSVTAETELSSSRLQGPLAEITSAGSIASSGAEADAAEKKKNKLLRVTPRMRKPSPIDYSYTGNIYILPERALTEYLLQPSDLEELPKYTRRSPYAEGTRITLYLRTDVEEVAISKWGSFDKLNKEKAKLRGSEGGGKYDIKDLRALLGEAYSHSEDPHTAETSAPSAQEDPGAEEPGFWRSGTTRVVLSAILVNAANTLFKLIAWLYTGSHSMFSEFIHSCADTMNQIILGIGLYHSFKKPDTDHPYGYRNLRNISSLISGVGIFFFGTGLSYYHSLIGFLHPSDLGNLHWCIATLIGSFISEGATLIIAFNQVRKSAKAHEMKISEYLLRGMDPNVNVVLLEDFAAVLGVGIAGACISWSAWTGSSFADALGSALIGTLLGAVAAFIVHQNTIQLVGRSIPQVERQDIRELLETDRMIRSLHDIKATQMGGVVRFKAEVDFDGREITRAYLYKQDLDLLLLEVQNMKTVEELEQFMLNHGEKIIDALGAEVDRIEKLLKAKHPEVRHVDLEAL